MYGKDNNSTARGANNPSGFDKPACGLKTYAFWTLIILVCLLAWGNMVLTAVVYKVLRMGQGMECLELLPEQGLVKFYGETDLDNVLKPDGNIKGFGNTPFEIKGKRASVMLEVEEHKMKSSLVVEQNGTHVSGVKDFQVGSTFSTESPNFKLTKRTLKLESKMTSTNHISSGMNEKLTLRSDSSIKLSGSEGTNIDGKDISWIADQHVLLKSINGSIILSGREGVIIKANSISVVKSPSMSTLSTQYKLCVCMPEGRLFRVPVPKDRSSHTACHNIQVAYNVNPCM